MLIRLEYPWDVRGSHSSIVTVRVHAMYTVEVCAECKKEETLTAYNDRVPAASLYHIEKNVVKVLRMSRAPQRGIG
jgi:hypothetical protein